MAETPADQSPARTQPELLPGSGQQYWCYHCDKRVVIDTLADLPDVVCCECKNGFVESISEAAIPSADAVDPLNLGSQFIQVLRLIAQAAREEDAHPTLPADPSNDDYLQIEMDEWDNDDEDDEDEDDEHSEEAENRERGTENNRSDEEEEEEEEEEEGGMEIEANEEDAETMRQYRRSVLQLSMSDSASRRMILERGLNWIDDDDDDDDDEEEEEEEDDDDDEEEDEDDEHSVEVVSEEDAENREYGTDNNRNQGEDFEDEEGIEVTEPLREAEDEEMRRRHRRDVLRLSLRDFASRAASRRNRILDWADVLMGMENHSIELTLQVPDSDTYVGNPGDYVDASEYEALLQTLAENDSGGRRGAPPAAKAAVEGLESVEIDKEENTVVCSICKDSVNVGEIAKNLPCGHGYHGECIVPWLGSRNSCPVCRFELPTDDPEYEEERKKRVVLAGLRAASSSSSPSAAGGGGGGGGGGDSTGSASE